jgi:hypothetical protein
MPFIFRTADNDRVSTKLRHFRSLRIGWHYGRGKPPAEKTMEAASWLHREALFLGFTSMDAFPGVNGEIMLTIYAPGSNYMELTVEPDGTISFAHEINRAEQPVPDNRISALDARHLLKNIASSIWSMSISSISPTTTPTGTNLKVWLSKTLQTTGSFQLFRSNASTELPDPFVTMPEDFTPPWHQNRPSIGDLQKPFSQLEPQ